MAGEAFYETRWRNESAKDHTFLVVLARCDGVAVERSVPRQSVFAIRLAIDFSDERNGLQTGAEGPIAALGRGRWRERMSVRGIGLRCEVGRMAGTAGFGARIIGGAGGEQDGNQPEDCQGGGAHL